MTSLDEKHKTVNIAVKRIIGLVRLTVDWRNPGFGFGHHDRIARGVRLGVHR